MRLNADNCYSMTMVEVIDISDISEAPPPKSKPSPQYLKLHISLPSTHISTSLTDQAMSANKPRPKSLSPTPGKHRNKKVSSNLIEWALKTGSDIETKAENIFTHTSPISIKEVPWTRIPAMFKSRPQNSGYAFWLAEPLVVFTQIYQKHRPTYTRHNSMWLFTPTSELHLNCFERYLQKR